MTHPTPPSDREFGEIDSLVSRIKSVARRLEVDDTTQAPPPFAYREALGELLASPHSGEASPLRYIANRHVPTLAEVFCADKSDEVFLNTAYRLLLNRAPDESGLESYLAQLPKAGRLYVLADLLSADETQTSLRQRGVRIDWQANLTRPIRLSRKLGPLKRLTRPFLRVGYRLASIVMRPRLQVLARLRAMEVRSQRRDELVRDVLLEIDGELQRTNEHVSAELQRLSEKQRAQQQDHTAFWSALQHYRRAVERMVAAPGAFSQSQAESEPPRNTPESAGLLSQARFDAYYLAFEDACRGSEEDIRRHLMNYQPLLEAAHHVGNQAMDLGCGRGEWLALLQEHGFTPHGVDLNEAMVEHCRKRGFNVTYADAIAALRQQPDNSHALVSGFHIAEHLPFDVLYTLVDEAQRILKPGGVMLLETPNPENVLVGSHTFYHDPTHRNPLTPTAMTFLLTYHGFGDVHIQRYNPYPESAKVPGDDPLTERVNGHFCGPQDFAVVGQKVAPMASAQESVNGDQEGV
ncbi:methyltransferase domain-containing protein [Vreelandella salicampi]|uniref:Methyltransferase domain-containing protein n=1 Tax=Vreelandella salicampi TaxID=1449798 RepID=A0A7Z0RUA0_9GAMM|nr:methyltransferase domain-containing protein [Halomonas salicampi]NYS60352.1 methyltransferase domain-containing protein [Halomonas salicampi]